MSIVAINETKKTGLEKLETNSENVYKEIDINEIGSRSRKHKIWKIKE